MRHSGARQNAMCRRVVDVPGTSLAVLQFCEVCGLVGKRRASWFWVKDPLGPEVLVLFFCVCVFFGYLFDPQPPVKIL